MGGRRATRKAFARQTYFEQNLIPDDGFSDLNSLIDIREDDSTAVRSNSNSPSLTQS